jgi:hypothetical protein
MQHTSRATAAKQYNSERKKKKKKKNTNEARIDYQLNYSTFDKLQAESTRAEPSRVLTPLQLRKNCTVPRPKGGSGGRNEFPRYLIDIANLINHAIGEWNATISFGTV